MNQLRPLLLPRKKLSEVLCISEREVTRWENENRLPKFTQQIKRTKFWSYSDLELWIELGMPYQQEFEERKKTLRTQKSKI